MPRASGRRTIAKAFCLELPAMHGMTGWADRPADWLENGWVDEVERCECVGGEMWVRG